MGEMDRSSGEESVPKRHAPVTVDVMRGPMLESRHVVYGVLLRGDGPDPEAALEGRVGQAWGDPGFLTVTRSALKPLQALPLILDSAADAFGLGDEELALTAGSHAGSPDHLRVLDRLMKKAGVEESMLMCPGHAPFDPESAREIGAGWGKRHDNCSGKHAGMIAWSRHAGHDPTGYTSTEHPVQDRILEAVARLSGEQRAGLGLAVDGCRVPTVGLKLASIARLFLLLGVPDLLSKGKQNEVWGDEAAGVEQGLARMADAMAAHPLMVAGEGRLDTDVIRTTKGRVITKVGAEGLWAGVDRERRVAFAFKTIDGAMRAVAPAALAILQKAGVVSSREHQTLSTHSDPVVRDRSGDKVGRLRVHAPV